MLIAKKHEASPEIKSRLQNLEQKWTELIRASIERGKVLEEAKDILAFNEEVDKVEAWIRDKVDIRQIPTINLTVCNFGEFTVD